MNLQGHEPPIFHRIVRVLFRFFPPLGQLPLPGHHFGNGDNRTNPYFVVDPAFRVVPDIEADLAINQHAEPADDPPQEEGNEGEDNNQHAEQEDDPLPGGSRRRAREEEDDEDEDEDEERESKRFRWWDEFADSDSDCDCDCDSYCDSIREDSVDDDVMFEDEEEDPIPSTSKKRGRAEEDEDDRRPKKSRQ
ncbi:hypothetical protein ABVT39_010515 [Epinephelus coioides]